MSTIIEIERIISRGSKQTTYKLAVLRAIVDFIIEHPGREPRNGWHFIPVLDLARRALTYYWRLALEGVPQGHGHESVKIPRFARELAASGITWPGLDFSDRRAGWQLGDLILRRAMPERVRHALLDTREVLIDQPLLYLPNVAGSRVRFFSVVTTADSTGQPPIQAPHETHLQAAPGKAAFSGLTWPELLTAERTHVVLSSRSFEEIAAVRYWLLHSIKLRWALECERFGDKTDGADASPISIPSFELTASERDPVLMNAFRKTYGAIGLGVDLYTGKSFPDAWHLDPVLPWSVFPVNLFWNLVPSAAAMNTEKAARVPTLTNQFRERYLDFLTQCLGSGLHLVLEDERETYRRYFQSNSPPTSPPGERARALLSLLEKSHGRLVDAGVDSWEPEAA